MKHFVWILVAVLLLAHHDFWFWNDDRLVFGFLPIGLFYHVFISIAAACVWFLAVTMAWPRELDEEATQRFSSQLTTRHSTGTLRSDDQTLVEEDLTVRGDNTVRTDEEPS